MPAFRLPASATARAAVLSAATIVAVLAQELGVRLVLPDFDPYGQVQFTPATVDTPALGPKDSVRRQIKNTGDYDVIVRFNRHGLRDAKDVGIARPSDFFLVGSSFAFGWGMAENDRISERLEALIGRPVFNLGITTDIKGYGALLDYARRLGAPVRQVILCITMETDVKYYGRPDSEPPPAVAKTAPPSSEAMQAFRAAKTFLAENSAVYFLTASLIQNSPALRDVALRLGLIAHNLESMRMRAFDPEAVAQTADATAQVAASYDTTILVIPARGLWTPIRAAEESRIHVALIAALRQRRLDVIDLRPIFEAGGRPLDYHFANDGHWNQRGHAKAAEVLAEHLRRRGL